MSKQNFKNENKLIQTTKTNQTKHKKIKNNKKNTHKKITKQKLINSNKELKKS